MKRILTALAFVTIMLGLAGCRPYSDVSPWNLTAAAQGTITSSNPYAAYFGSQPMIFGGGPGGSSSHDHDYAKPIFLATDDSPCVPVALRHPDWNNSDTQIPASDCVPVPTGLQAAAGTDGHVTIVNAAKTFAWSFWRAKLDSDTGPPLTEANVLARGRIEAANGSRWALGGSGVASCCGSATGRGSGTELLTNVLRSDEAGGGVPHALGLSIPHIACGAYITPAIKSDGDCGSPVKYGMLFVLRGDYTCPVAQGPANVCNALKSYGVRIVDQLGGCCSFSELDTAGDYGTEVGKWQAIGISRGALPIAASDWRCVDLNVTAANDC